MELFVKCECKNVAEIPIHFSNRIYGESKLNLKQQFQYLQHLRRLFIFKYAERSYICQFLLIGSSGTVINLALLTLLLSLKFSHLTAVSSSIFLSMCFNFLMNRRLTFSYARNQSYLKQFFGFMGACSVGAFINFWITIHLIHEFQLFQEVPQLASIIGIVSAMSFNYIINRFIVFKKKIQ